MSSAAANVDHPMAYDWNRNHAASRRPDGLEEQEQHQMMFMNPQWGGPRVSVDAGVGVGAGGRPRARALPAVGPPCIDPIITSSTQSLGNHGGYLRLNSHTALEDHHKKDEGADEIDAAFAVAGRVEPGQSWGSSLRSSVSVPDGHESLRGPVFPRRSHAVNNRRVRSEPTTPESMHETIQARLNSMPGDGGDVNRGWTAGEPVGGRKMVPEGSSTHQSHHEDPVPPAWSQLKTKAGKQRRRLPLACYACRQKKVRCSGELPSCKHCLRWRISCVYKTRTQKAPPRKVSKSSAEDGTLRTESGKRRKSKDVVVSAAKSSEMEMLPDAVSQHEHSFQIHRQNIQQRHHHQQQHNSETAQTGESEGRAKRGSESSVEGGVPLGSTQTPVVDPIYLSSSEPASKRPSLASLDQPSGVSLGNTLNFWQGQQMSVLSPPDLASQSRGGNVQPVLILAVMPVQSDGKGTSPQISEQQQRSAVQEVETTTPCKVEQDPFDRTEETSGQPPSQFFHPPMSIPSQMSSLNIFPPMAFSPAQLAEYEQQANEHSTYPQDSYHQQTESNIEFGSTIHPPMILPPQYYSNQTPLSEHYPSDVTLQSSRQPAESNFSYHQSVDLHPTPNYHMMPSPHLHPPMVLPSPLQNQPNVDPIEHNERKPSMGESVVSESGGHANYSDSRSMAAGHGGQQQARHGYGDYSAGHGVFYDQFSNVSYLPSTTAPETSTFSWAVEVTTAGSSDGAGMRAWPGANEFGGGGGGGSDDRRGHH
ncbi:MAG: hypothetical protein M1823_004951 [Watsoniomyces obsoletus]|nr:MAG: hypothetical protein M1823_004951 [Watsoniomyces obsoletus]